MVAAVAPYLVAVSAMLFSALSALTLIHVVGHLDPPEIRSLAKPVIEQVAV
jgi:hypothetical protein